MTVSWVLVLVEEAIPQMRNASGLSQGIGMVVVEEKDAKMSPIK
jgi:hypothetical protein